jgi:hypothetical protein
MEPRILDGEITEEIGDDVQKRERVHFISSLQSRNGCGGSSSISPQAGR